MSGDRILDAEEVIALLPTQAALIRLGKSHELLRERLRTAETENERLSAGFGVAQAGWENAEGRVAALTEALRAADDALTSNAPLAAHTAIRYALGVPVVPQETEAG